MFNKLSKYIIKRIKKPKSLIAINIIKDKYNNKRNLLELNINHVRPRNLITNYNNQISIYLIANKVSYTLNYAMYYDDFGQIKLQLLTIVYTNYNNRYIIKKNKSKLVCVIDNKEYLLKGRNELRLKYISFAKMRFENRIPYMFRC